MVGALKGCSTRLRTCHGECEPGLCGTLRTVHLGGLSEPGQGLMKALSCPTCRQLHSRISSTPSKCSLLTCLWSEALGILWASVSWFLQHLLLPPGGNVLIVELSFLFPRACRVSLMFEEADSEQGRDPAPKLAKV